MRKKVDKYLDKVFEPSNSLSGTFRQYPDPLPAVGDSISIHGMKFKVTKVFNRRKSKEYECVMKKIRERK